jgi:hypothetical protein
LPTTAATVVGSRAALLWLQQVPERWGTRSYSVTHNPRLFILLLLEMFAGTVMVSGAWLAGSFVLLDLLWIALAIHAGGDDAVFVVATLITSQMFAIVIHRLVQNSLVQAEEHRLAMEHQLVDAEACIEGDPTQFSTMLVNLGINASDAMSGKGRMIATGYAMEEEVQSLVSTGARVLEKPFKIQALEQEIERVLPRVKN